MRVLERLACNFMWLAWIIFLVGSRHAHPEQRPTMPGTSGEACRCLIPDRTILPGW